MANPAKRTSSDGAGADGPSAAPTPAKVVPPKAKAKKAATAGPTRYTPSTPTGTHRKPSPRWVPVLMFALWGLGLMLIILNYMGVLPGTQDDANGWYLVSGLVSILAGIMVATQYH